MLACDRSAIELDAAAMPAPTRMIFPAEHVADHEMELDWITLSHSASGLETFSSRHERRFAAPIAVGRDYEGNNFQCPSETT